MKETKRLIHSEKEKWYLAPSESDDMIYAYVERIRGQYVTAFNLFREDTAGYMFSCSCDASMTGKLVFHTVRDSHLRKLEDITESEVRQCFAARNVATRMCTSFEAFCSYSSSLRFAPH